MRFVCACLALSLVLLPVFRAVAEPDQILLWPRGAPGSEGKSGDEQTRTTPQGDHVISGVHHPAIIPYLPDPATSTGAAVVVIPGGGHSEIWIDHEGYNVAHWLRDHGVAAFVLKYRLAREKGSTYTVEGDELADTQRAIRLVRSRAAAWHIAPDRIGVIGFSAGGELSALAGTHFDAGKAGAADAIDREGSKPAFMGLIYPAIPKDMPLSKDTPPAFLAFGENDRPTISEDGPRLYLALKQAGVPVEMHVFTGTGHGFGIRDRNPPAIAIWPTLFLNWLGARGLLASH